MVTIDISLSVNGRPISGRAEPRRQLCEFLREDLNLTGTHVGCEQGVCGSCTVVVDDKPQRSCISYVGDSDGCRVTTIEGFDDDPLMDELRGAFSRHHALQCGFCTPGMLITARDIVLRLGEIGPARIREELSGNLCRCTGYVGIVEAIEEVCKGKLPKIYPGDVTLKLAQTSGSPNSGPIPKAPDKPSAQATVTIQAPKSISESHKGWSSIEQRLEVASPPAQLWEKLSDIRQVSSCLPGAEVTRVDGNRIEGRMNVALGPMKIAFSGEASVTLDAARRAGCMTGRGRDAGSGSMAEGAVEWHVEPGSEDGAVGSLLLVTFSWRLSGRLAQFNRVGLVQDLIGRLASLFVANLEASMRGDFTAPLAVKPLGLWSLLWGVLKGRLMGWRQR